MSIKIIKEKFQKLREIRFLLKKGFYILDPKREIIERVSLAKYLFALFSKKFPITGTKNGTYAGGNFKTGFHKSVFLSDDKAFVVYDKERSFVNYIQKHKYLDWLIYEHPKDINFQYEQKCVIQERCFGENLNKERFNFSELYSALHYFSKNIINVERLKQEIIIKGEKVAIYYCYQEGDFAPCNIVKNKNGYVAIDFDNADFYPIGYDFFYFLFFKTELDIFNLFFSNYEKYVETIFANLFSSFSIKFSKEIFELYFCAFVIECTSEKNIYNRFVFKQKILDRINSLKDYKIINDFISYYFEKV